MTKIRWVEFKDEMWISRRDLSLWLYTLKDTPEISEEAKAAYLYIIVGLREEVESVNSKRYSP